MQRIIVYFSALVTVIYSACTVSKDLPAPVDSVPAAYRDAVPADTAGIAAIQWKSFFHNEGLQRLIDSALRHNYDLQAAAKSIEAASLMVKQSRLGYLPVATAQAAATINRPSDNSLNGLSLNQFLGKSYVEDYTLTVTLGWEADFWGKVKLQKAKARAAFLLQEESGKAIGTELVAAIATGYYNLLMLDAQLAIARKNLALNDSTLQLMQLQYQSGEISALAVQQAGSQRLVAAGLIPRLEEAITLQENALTILAGIAPGPIQRSGDIREKVFAGIPSAGIPSALLDNRPDVKIRELELRIANASTGLAKTAMYPSLTITAGGGINAFKASNWFTVPASLFAMGTGGITQPLFQHNQLKTIYKVSALDRERTVIRFRQTVLKAIGEVSDALARTGKLEEQRSAADARVQLLEQATGNANLLFKNGLANYLEVITAESNALQGELELAVIRKEQSSNMIELYRALGGGWR
ncbi:MAG: TolC family protein [Chitinophagaceae bacterium]